MSVWPVTVFLLGLGAGCAAIAPHVIRCAGTPLRVEGAGWFEAQIACDGARATLAFLAPLRSVEPAAITVALAPALPKGAAREAVGCFERSSQRVVVLQYRVFARRGSWFGVPVDATIYQALFSHEIAHAVAAGQAGERRISRVAQEYVAYVTMFATMDPTMRAAYLERHPGTGFDNAGQISELILALDPTYFALESYRHWTRQADPQSFMRRVLDGQELGDSGD